MLNARQWRVVDATDQTVGRLASVVASFLRGKLNPSFSPHLDCGDFVIVVNAHKVRFSGNKMRDKIYYRHSEYPGGIRETTASQMLEHHPERILKIAIEGMLPKTRLGRQMATKLKVYAGPEHPHKAQRPEGISIGE
ncbi:MAG: 50S ribosomal protein L13 [Candidatus Binatia bacterium]